MNATTSEPSSLGPLYHGTRQGRAHQILRGGFRRAKAPHYLGTGICMSESITTAYEHGEYERRGCVLQAWLAPAAHWTDREEMRQRENWFEACDRFFIDSGMDAVRAYAGNVWVVWNPAVLVAVRRLTHREALRLACREFDENGPDVGYNGIAEDYASIWWGQESRNANLTRFPEDCRALRDRLQRFVGRSRTELPLAAALAKAQCSETYFSCASESIQLHGGVGFTWEYDPHLYFKRARASESFLGLPAWHRERIASVILGEQP